MIKSFFLLEFSLPFFQLYNPSVPTFIKFVQMFRRRNICVALHCHDTRPQTTSDVPSFVWRGQRQQSRRLFFSLSQIHTHLVITSAAAAPPPLLIRIKVARRRFWLLPQPPYQAETGRPREIPPTPEHSGRADQSAPLAVRRSRRATRCGAKCANMCRGWVSVGGGGIGAFLWAR